MREHMEVTASFTWAVQQRERRPLCKAARVFRVWERRGPSSRGRPWTLLGGCAARLTCTHRPGKRDAVISN